MSYPSQEPPKPPLNVLRSAGWGMAFGMVAALAPGAGELTDLNWAVGVFGNGAFGALFFTVGALFVNRNRGRR